MLNNGIPQLCDTFARITDSGNDGWAPCVVCKVTQFQHLLNIATCFFHTFAVCFVDDKDVRNFHETSFVRLHRVAPTRVQHNNSGVCLAGDFHFHLTHTHGLYKNPLAPNGIKHANGFRCGQRQTTQVTACGHRTNEDTRVGRMVLHTYSITQNGTTGEWRRRVNCKNCNL